MSQQKIGKVWNFSRNLKLLYFLPLSLLLLERLWLPFASIGSSSYLDVETTAVTRKQKDVNARSAAELPMLAQLTASATDWIMCPGKTEVITNKINEPDSSSSSKRQIPMIIHQTAKSRCLTPTFHESSTKWKLQGFEYYFHDDKAVNRLLRLDFPEFPKLRNILRNCVKSRNVKTRLWEYLVLYYYGGVFADFGSIPKNFDEQNVGVDDDGIFVSRDDGSSLSHSFIAVSPRHPIVYFAIQHFVLRLLEKSYVTMDYSDMEMSFHALRKAFEAFNGGAVDQFISKTFVGVDDRSIRVIGDEQFLVNFPIDQNKRKGDYSIMGMTTGEHLETYSDKSSELSCVAAILKDVSKVSSSAR